MEDFYICDRCGREVDVDEVYIDVGVQGTLCPDCYFEETCAEEEEEEEEEAGN